MKRGISFEIPNAYGSYLGEILEPFNMTAFNWYIGGEESYFVDDDTLGEPLFPKEIYGIDGLLLKTTLEDNKYYVIFANLKAYPKEQNVIDVRTYEDFLNSDCQLALLVVDCAYVTIYCKDKDILEGLYQNAVRHGYDDIKFVTDENDRRTKLSVW